MKTSITTIPWGRMQTLGQFRRVLNDAKKIGYQGIGLETRMLPKELRANPERVWKIVEGVGIENAGSYSTMKPSDVDWAANSKTPLLWVVALNEMSHAKAMGTLGQMTKHAKEAYVVIALHNHLGTAFETEPQMKRALEENRDLEVCFDTAHAEGAGVDSVDFVRKHHERIALVHVKDLRRKVPKSKLSFAKDFVNIGAGIIDFKPVFDALHDVGYEGHLMLEIEALTGKKPVQLAREGYALMAEHLLGM